MKPVSNLYTDLGTTRKVLITMHQKPDGDAMGSSLGLYHFLTNLGHSVQVISPTNWANFLDWMPGADKVLDFEAKKADCEQFINEAEWIFCLDFNTLSRTRNMEPLLANAAGKRILIDHHQQPQTKAFHYGISDTTKSSTAEMVYDFIAASPFADTISSETAECIYTGLMTDTGSFRFPSTSSNVHRIVASLIDKGLEHSKIHESIFDTSSESRLRFFGKVLLDRMKVFYEYNTALICVPQADLIKYNIKTGDTEGLVNFPLSIEGIKLAAIVIDRGEERKWSFRSKGEFDVNSFARRYFNGGGHYNAAGGQTKDCLEKTERDFMAALADNRASLTSYQF